MGQLSNATQQNASASEELAATSEELSGQAKQLQDSIAFFNVGERSGGATPVRASRPERLATASARTPLLRSASVRSDLGSNFKPY
jgi:methyl-accepting chemotaxis protein